MNDMHRPWQRLIFPWQPYGVSQIFSPSILPCDCVTIGWAVDETDVDSNERRSIRGHDLSTDDTSMAVKDMYR